MGENTFDAYAKVEENPDGGVFISVAIDLGGSYLNSTEHVSRAKVMESILTKFAVKASKNVIDEEIKTEEKALKEREKELSDLEKEQEKLEKEIEDYEKRIKDNEIKIEESKTAQTNQKTLISEQAEKLKAVEKKKAAVK
jgi:septal ring factor EnvC (AmiA/AmiB activator)